MKPAILKTPDLLRVVGLPRRTLDLKQATEYAAELTAMLALHPDEALRPWQGQILHEAITCRGVYAGAPVGLGKTLLGWLLPVVLEAERPMLLIPGGAREDTHLMYKSYLGRWRRCARGIKVYSIQDLTRLENVDLLERERPDLIIIDEADTLRNAKSSVPRRIGRYVGEHEPMVCAMTGTPGRLSIMDLHHFLVWCLKEGAPMPLKHGEAAFWAAAIDVAKGWGAKARPHAGALELLGGGTSEDGLRLAFRDRLTQTPGVVIVDGDSCDQPIIVTQEAVPSDPKLEEHFKVFRKKNVTPDGWPTTDRLSVYRLSGELGTGGFSRWNPRPPDWWYLPYKSYCSFVRLILDKDEGHDTEAAVAHAYADADEVKEWLAVKDKWTPNTEWVWLTDSVLRFIAAWIKESPVPVLLWTWNVAFAEALSTMTGLTYYGAGGRDRHGNHISALKCYGPKGKKLRGTKDVPSIILSGQANSRIRNLQAWTRNGFVNFPRSSRDLEQAMGRTHRSEQDQPVEYVFFMTSGDSFDGFSAAVVESGFGKTSFGLTQKLLRANVRYTDIPGDSPYRWRTKDDEDEE